MAMNLFLELRADRLSLEGRGTLWTLMSHEGQRLSEATLTLLLGQLWRSRALELTRSGIGVLQPKAPGIYVFRRFPTPFDRRREKERARQRRRNRKGA